MSPVPLLYVLVAEVLACNIRSNGVISDLSLPGSSSSLPLQHARGVCWNRRVFFCPSLYHVCWDVQESNSMTKTRKNKRGDRGSLEESPKDV